MKSWFDLYSKEKINKWFDDFSPIMDDETKFDLLATYTALRRGEKTGTGRTQLVFIHLQKRLLSSIEAFHRTLSVHAAAFGAGSLAPGAREEEESSPAEEFGETDTELELELDEQVRDESSERAAVTVAA